MNAYYVAKQIVDATASQAGITAKKIIGRDRSQYVCNQRDTVVYLLRQLTPLSTPEIGAFLGGRNHSSILSALKRETNRLKGPQAASLKLFHQNVLKESGFEEVWSNSSTPSEPKPTPSKAQEPASIDLEFNDHQNGVR